ncbi:MAG: flagellar biosynthetic protein FliQ [Myxococcales bacterium]|nr:flagellar biosynthetic protein FliQ [Myxococcales bacterium]MDD9967949.1 flagellar biosynthetic protein FliQ [Myxococcales bacterium]
MDGGLLADFLYEACLLALILAAPALAVGVVVGLVVGAFAAATHIQDPTLVFVPKLVAVVGTLLATGSLLAERLVRFTRDVMGALS